MEETQFNLLMRELRIIEKNTRKEGTFVGLAGKEFNKEFEIELLNKVQEIFFERLKERTGWGRNEIKDLFKTARFDASIEIARLLRKDISF